MLGQMKNILFHFEENTFVEPRTYLNNSTIGQHFRHILEFYQCLSDQLSCREICYDDRKRDLNLETNIGFAHQTIDDLSSQLSLIKGNAPLKLIASYDPQSEQKEIMPSSVQRELAYLLDHTIHHLAIVKIMLTLEGIAVPGDFGVAPSTLRFQNQSSSKV